MWLAEKQAGKSIQLPGYLATYLPAHISACGAWEALGTSADVLDRLDPDRLAVEAFRRTHRKTQLPAPVAAGIVSREALRSTPLPMRRRTIRALGMERLRRADPSTLDPSILWARLPPTYEHLPMTGQTSTVTAICAVRMPDGTTLLATGSYDGTIRLWNPTTGTPTGPPIPATPAW